MSLKFCEALWLKELNAKHVPAQAWITQKLLNSRPNPFESKHDAGMEFRYHFP